MVGLPLPLRFSEYEGLDRTFVPDKKRLVVVLTADKKNTRRDSVFDETRAAIQRDCLGVAGGHRQSDLLKASPASSVLKCSNEEFAAKTQVTVAGMNVHASYKRSVSFLSAALALDAYGPNKFFFRECAEEDSLVRAGHEVGPLCERLVLFVLIGRAE